MINDHHHHDHIHSLPVPQLSRHHDLGFRLDLINYSVVISINYTVLQVSLSRAKVDSRHDEGDIHHAMGIRHVMGSHHVIAGSLHVVVGIRVKDSHHAKVKRIHQYVDIPANHTKAMYAHL